MRNASGAGLRYPVVHYTRRAVAAALAVSLPFSALAAPQPAQASPNPAAEIQRMLSRMLPQVDEDVARTLGILAAILTSAGVLAMLNASGSSTLGNPAVDGAGGATLRPGTVYTRAISVGGRARSYDVILPRGYDASKSYPVIIGFGGWQHDAATTRGYQRLEDAAADTIVVYAQGVDNAWGGAPYANTSLDQDIAYAREVISDVSARYGGDPSRVAAVGLSNGGGMAAALACHAPGTVDAVAAVAGAFYTPTVTGCAPGAVPVMLMHGTNDDVVAYGGGTRHGARYASVDEVAETFARKNGCSTQWGEVRAGTVSTVSTLAPSTCATDTRVLKVWGGGHTWFDGSPDATREAVRFVQRYL